MLEEGVIYTEQMESKKQKMSLVFLVNLIINLQVQWLLALLKCERAFKWKHAS